MEFGLAHLQLVDHFRRFMLTNLTLGGYEFIMTNYRAKDKICIFGKFLRLDGTVWLTPI